MFQNLSKIFENKIEENSGSQKEGFYKDIIKQIFKIQNIAIYILAFMISTVGFSEKMEMIIMPFGVALIAAALSCKLPIVGVYIMTLIGTALKHGANGLIIYFLASAVFFLCTLIKRPREQEDVNEQRRVGKHLVTAMMLVQMIYMLIKGFYLYDFMMSMIMAVVSLILYKVFVNSMPVIKNYGVKKAFSVEEVVAVSILLTIAINCLGDFQILGFSLRNILSILIVLVLGWKNGVLVGATSGITIGVIVGVLANGEPMVIAAYALSGMAAGILNRFGKIGVAARIYPWKCHNSIYYKWWSGRLHIIKRNPNCLYWTICGAKEYQD